MGHSMPCPSSIAHLFVWILGTSLQSFVCEVIAKPAMRPKSFHALGIALLRRCSMPTNERTQAAERGVSVKQLSINIVQPAGTHLYFALHAFMIPTAVCKAKVV